MTLAMLMNKSIRVGHGLAEALGWGYSGLLLGTKTIGRGQDGNCHGKLGRYHGIGRGRNLHLPARRLRCVRAHGPAPELVHPAARRVTPRKLCFSLTRNNRL